MLPTAPSLFLTGLLPPGAPPHQKENIAVRWIPSLEDLKVY